MVALSMPAWPVSPFVKGAVAGSTGEHRLLQAAAAEAGLISKWNMVERLQAHIAKNYADSLLPATECNLVKTELVRFRAVASTVPAHGTMGGRLCTKAVRPPCSNRKNNTYVGAGRPHLWTSRDWRHWPGLATSRKNLNHWSSLL